MSWIGRGARFTLGATLIVGAITLAFAAGRVLILVFKPSRSPRREGPGDPMRPR